MIRLITRRLLPVSTFTIAGINSVIASIAKQSITLKLNISVINTSMLFLISLLSFLLASCASHYGATQLPPDRTVYNKALQYSDNQQMLLNIVRLRYTDVPYFLTVNNVVSQFSFSRHAGVALNNQPSPPLTVGASGDASADISESPTITYTPYQGESYVTKLLTPIDLSVVAMLLRAGWGINAVFRLTVQRLGGLENAVLASRSVSRHIPEYKEFHDLGRTLLDLQYSDNLAIMGEKNGESFSLKLTVRDFTRLNAADRKLLAKHGFTPATPSLILVDAPTNEPGKLFVQTRTVLGVLNYLSKGVDPPVDDIMCKKIPMTKLPNGGYFDWRLVTKGQIKVHYSNTQPADAYVMERYKDHWFYICEDDFDSKETLNMLSIIMGIYQGEVKTFLPVFTVS